MREIRLALLEADINFKVVREFVNHVKERALGAEVMESLTPAQQVVKIVDEELVALMGSGNSRLAFSGRPPTVILLAGLQGSGKTTTCAKLAQLLVKDGKRPVLIAADVYRPAAIEQLVTLAERVGVPVFAPGAHLDPSTSPETVWPSPARGATWPSSTRLVVCTSTTSSWRSSCASARRSSPTTSCW